MSLYHYTNLSAVRSIIENQEIWLTSIQYLNDEEELIDGLHCFDRAYKELQSIEEGIDSTENERYNTALKRIQEAITGAIEFYEDLNFNYIFSFSRRPDHLSQWRSYGNYCIEFDEEILNKHLSLFDCVYHNETKIQIAKEAIHQIIPELLTPNKFEYNYLTHLVDVILPLAAIFKSHHFEDENEARILINDGIPDNIIHTDKGSILIPRYTLKLQEHAIKNIHIGPMKDQNLAKQSMAQFLHFQKFKQIKNNNFDIGDIKVTTSKIPYREL